MITYIEASDESYQIVYTVNSLCAYEDRFKEDIAMAISSPSVSRLRGMLWAGLIDKQPNLTLENTGKIIDDYLGDADRQLSDIANVCVKALTNSGFFKKAGNEKNPAERQKKAKA